MLAGRVRVLIVDDEAIVRQSLGAFLQEQNFEVHQAESGQQALEMIASKRFDVVVLDVRMPGMDGLETLKEMKARLPDLPVIMITAYADVTSAVSAMKLGAYDYVLKPFDPEEILRIIRNVVAHQNLIRENLQLRQKLEERERFEELLGRSPKMRAVFDLIQAVADTNVTVLIQGESGTGKELVARALHRRSSRAGGPFVAVSCGGLPESLIESELFGYERGAFTGAVSRRKGRFELADGGTIFLDEIGEISPKVQVDLLRVLESRRFVRLGGTEEIAVDVRVVAATNRNLQQAVKEGRFREDLYYRLNVVNIVVPPLRERKEDITLLANHFLKHYAKEMGRPVKSFSPDALAVMLSYHWPGNVRELQNAVEHAVAVSKTEMILLQDLPQDIPVLCRNETPAGKSLEEVERRHIAQVLAECEWNISRAASVLGIDRVTLYNRMKKYGLQRPEQS